jgi:ubiquinone/menaquinone biosynthesis C-methylase UbiE
MSEQAVAQHYSYGGLEQRILDALTAMGADPERLDADQLAPVDEFHIGGRAATVELVGRLDLGPGLRVLDIGSGLGGTARHLAREHAATVTGLDLTLGYVRVAASLTRRAGLAERIRFQQGSATDLPFPDGSFDRACMLHVGMNVADKAALFAEVRRVLVSGGRFGLYDVMRVGPGEVTYPVPWAATAATSFPAEPAEYRELLTQAGFLVQAERDRRGFGLDFFRELQTQLAQQGQPPLGLHLVMGPDTPVKIANLVDSLKRAVLAPTEMVCLAR